MTPRINDIAAFMKARHDIYLARKAGKPGPWTTDPILLEGRFCNIFRELDTVTIWIDQNIRQPYADHPHLWFMLAIARYINRPDTLRYLMDDAEPGCWPYDPGFTPAGITEALEEYAAQGNKVYTGAYTIRAERYPYKEWYGWSKHRYIAEIVLGRLWEDRERFAAELEKPGQTLEGAWKLFQEPRYVGWGPFMAYEVVTDLRHTRYLREATDIFTWANAGLGAIRGLNRLYGRELGAKPKPERTNAEMLKLMIELNDLDEPAFNETFGEPCDVNPRFEMRDIEHTLCEFDKYERVRRGEGKMRSKYDWRKAQPLAAPTPEPCAA
ncbi:MAG: nucleotide kinase domain-containing protein [Methanomethylophilus sp.]